MTDKMRLIEVLEAEMEAGLKRSLRDRSDYYL